MHKTKRIRSSLPLRTETLRTLNPSALVRVAGGLTATTPPVARECSTDTWTQDTGTGTGAACHISDGCTA